MIFALIFGRRLLEAVSVGPAIPLNNYGQDPPDTMAVSITDTVSAAKFATVARPRYGMTSKGSEDENGSGASRKSASSLAHNRSASNSWISTCGRAAGEEAVDAVTARISKATIPSVAPWRLPVKGAKVTWTSRS